MIKNRSFTALQDAASTCNMRLSAPGSPGSAVRARSPSPSPKCLRRESPCASPCASPFERRSTSGCNSILAAPMPDAASAAAAAAAVTVAAVTASPLLCEAPTLADALHDFQVECALHTNSFTLMQCEAQFGIPGEAPEVAAAPGLQEVQSLGACLATPVDADKGSRSVAATATRVSASSSAYQMKEEVEKCVSRWGDWIRRVRRKRRIEQVQALLAMFPRAGDQARSLDSVDLSVATVSGSYDELDAVPLDAVRPSLARQEPVVA